MKKIQTNVDIVDTRKVEGVTFKELQTGSYFLYGVGPSPYLCVKMVEPMYIAEIVDFAINHCGDDSEERLHKFQAVSVKSGLPISIIDEDDIVTPVDVAILVKEFGGED